MVVDVEDLAVVVDMITIIITIVDAGDIIMNTNITIMMVVDVDTITSSYLIFQYLSDPAFYKLDFHCVMFQIAFISCLCWWNIMSYEKVIRPE